MTEEDIVDILEVAETQHAKALDPDERQLRDILALLQAQVSRLNTEIAPPAAQRAAALPQITRMAKVLVPITLSTFPTEILVNIFKLCIDGSLILDSETLRADPLLNLALVCKRWGTIVKGTSVLWNDFFLDYKRWSNPAPLKNAALACIGRAGPFSPLSIHTGQPKTQNGVIAAAGANADPLPHIIIPFSVRLKHITLCLPFDWLDNFLTLPPGSIPILESADIQLLSNGQDGDPVLGGTMTVFAGAPNLRKLTFRLEDHYAELHQFGHGTPPPLVLAPDAQLQLPWTQLTHLAFIDFPVPHRLFHKMIRQCSQLQSFAATPLGPIAGLVGKTESTTLVSLNLELNNPSNLFKEYTDALVATNLRHLTLRGSHREWSQSAFSSLLSRLTCHLTHLTISINLQRSYLEPLLRLVPSVEVLELKECYISSTTIDKVLRGELLPHLLRLCCIMDLQTLERFCSRLIKDREDSAGVGNGAHSGIQSAQIYMDSEIKKAREYLDGLRQNELGIEIEEIRHHR
ncbi:hypothetical protein Hypma_002937 [Hypsizygus marmoreus]|uniref:F-box domain-containing protein n=1 Tax=Hypsizygus marmoreus TaxID=39966 RepID=A0A369J595_HYPMA|nr:hypothetical protein Hypma_002937 [Hypsizygus marmoreus]